MRIGKEPIVGKMYLLVKPPLPLRQDLDSRAFPVARILSNNKYILTPELGRHDVAVLTFEQTACVFLGSYRLKDRRYSSLTWESDGQDDYLFLVGNRIIATQKSGWKGLFKAL